MTAILGVFGTPALPDYAFVVDLLARMGGAGAARADVSRRHRALLAVSRPEWQLTPGMSADELVVEDATISVAADASLYYREDLCKALRAEGIEPRGEGPGALILSAYRAWGERCVEHLEGDWAFVLWDERKASVLCSRDFGGKRSLYHAEEAGGLVVATTIGGVLGFPGCPRDLNLTAIAETAAGLQAASHETCYRAVRRLHAGHNLCWRNGRSSVTRFWNPRPHEDAAAAPFDEAAVQLRQLIGRAAQERLSSTGPTSIQLSGGWDSSTIFALTQELFRRGNLASPLLPVSISYPPGDPGREDEIIEMITGHWNTGTHWLDIADIPLLQRPESSAAAREEPFAHVYEHWNRRLVEAARDLGTSVMFDGFGGDSLFQCSPAFMAELLRRGRFLELRREWRAKGMSGLANQFRWCVQPLLPTTVDHLLARLPNGRRFLPHLERDLPSWMDRRFAHRHGLLARERRSTPRPPSRSPAERELFWHLTNPWVTRMLAENYRYGLEAGVEMRSPLFDRRVIEFAIRRPRNERSHRRQTKRLLRASAAGLLPDDVLAPRRYRTGMTTGFFQRRMREELPRFRDGTLTNPVLASLGIVDPAALRRAIDEFITRGDMGTGVQLYFTLQTELWLRGHARIAADNPSPQTLSAVQLL